MHISEELKEQIKQNNDIVEVISSYIEVTKDGSLYKALCPFHQEKTSSLKIYPETQSFYCYGCNTSNGSDIISFVMNFEKVSFAEACKILAQRSGLNIAESEDEQIMRTEKEAVTKRNRRYFKALKENPEALQYLYSRGITDDTIARYRLGYVPLDEHPEKNRNRISFAIMDICSQPDKAHTLSMAYRTLNNEEPKYRNDPNSRIYKKSNALYLLSHAVQSVRDQGHAIVVEGYMDALRLHQAGMTNTVSIMGTSFAVEQMKLLRKYTDMVYLWLDNDDAGRTASRGALPDLLKLGFSVYLVHSIKDPDETVAALSEASIEQYIENNSHMALASLINEICTQYDSAVIKARGLALKKLMPILDHVENTTDRSICWSMVEQRLQINLSARKSFECQN